VALAALAAAACGDSPIRPGNNPPPSQQQPPAVNNTAPTITSITVQGNRRNEPANFADLSESVAVSAVVTDPETSVDMLQYNWTATAGSFTGSGPRVSWVAPSQATTPTIVTITLELVERFGVNQENKVTKTATIALHDSAREVGDMARLFLQEFSDSNVRNGASIVRNFTDATRTCADGKSAEAGEINQNRIDYRITAASLGAANVTVDFGGRCAFRNKPGDACARVPASWTSTRLTTGGAVPVGGTERVAGTDQVTAIYVASQQKWGLCESDFDGVLLLKSTFIR